jgi:hypothetical protein
MLIEEYYVMLERHDWYYAYSDDSRVFARGEQAASKVVSISKESDKHKQLYKDYSAHIWSGKVFNTEKKPKPVVDNYL